MTDIPTREATGLPSWPITLVAGVHGSGKSHLCAEASASPLIATTYWIGYGELDPHEYAALPGASFKLVNHPGTVRGVINVVKKIAALPVPDNGANLIVIDSGSRIWDTIGEGVQTAKAAQRGSAAPVDSNDLWNSAKGEWQELLNALRAHSGPSIITARYTEDAVYVDGRATGEKEWRIKAEKGLPYDVDVVIQMKAHREYVLTKAASLRMQFSGEQPWADFTMDALWREMGLDTQVGQRSYAQPVPDGAPVDTSGRQWLAELDQCVSANQVAKLMAEANAARTVDRSIIAAIRAKHTSLTPTATPAADPTPNRKGTK